MCFAPRYRCNRNFRMSFTLARARTREAETGCNRNIGNTLSGKAAPCTG